MNQEPTAMQVLIMWRHAELERRRALMAELLSIERRWGVGRFQNDGPEIFRLSTADAGGTAVP